MPEPNDFGAAHPAPIVNARMAVRIQEHDIAGARKSRDDPEIRQVAGRKHDGGLPSEEPGQLALQGEVAGETPVGHSRPCSPCPLLLRCGAGRLDTVRIKGQPQIVVGAGKNCPPAVHDGFGGRENPFDNKIEGIVAAVSKSLPGLCERPEFV